MIKLAPSILSADFNILGSQMADTKRACATWAHFDVMDGSFVPQISFGNPVLKSLRKNTDLFLDVHLMVVNPERKIRSFADCGADMITFHYEATDDPGTCIAAIEETGKKVGLALKPGTPIRVIEPFMHRLDMLLVMTVEPGFGGQKYIPASTRRIAEARRMFTVSGLDTDIEVDGGIKRDNVDIVLNAGATVIVAGSAVYSGDVYENTKAFADHFKEWEAAH
ncbi:MAG: ribulose-phosphate 3-epimerase [Lachnospiraceae bacterium]|nr:ribulose-phosphate 3-epimerase [Lachnospiraceae bacterium]